MSKKLLLLSCAAGALSLFGARAMAATAEVNAQDATTVADVVVRAERREQKLMRAPVAVTVVTAAQRDQLGIQTMQDLTNFAPGLSFDNTTGNAWIHGVGKNSPNFTNDPRVSIYSDEFYDYVGHTIRGSSLFQQQTQVEDGPQNVTGRPSEGGSIDAVSVRPTDKPYAEVRAILGDYDTHSIEAAVSGPIAPGLNVRLAASDHNQDLGWWRNVANGIPEGGANHEWFVEGQLDWKPNDANELWIKGYAENWLNRGDVSTFHQGFNNGSWDEVNLTDNNAGLIGSLFVNPNFGYALPGSPGYAAAEAANLVAPGQPYVPVSTTLLRPGITNNPSLTDQNTFASILPQTIAYNGLYSIHTNFTHDFGNDVQLKYVGGYGQFSYYEEDSNPDTDVTSYTLGLPNSGGEGTFTGAPALQIFPLQVFRARVQNQWFSHEMLLRSSGDAPLQWTGGLYYFKLHYAEPVTIAATEQPQLSNPINPATGAVIPNPDRNLLVENSDFQSEEEAAYFGASYKVNDQFKLLGDIRYTNDSKWGVERTRFVFFGSGIIDALGPTLGVNTPALDITGSAACATGTAATTANPNACNTGPLAPGVASKGVIGPAGYETRVLAASSDALTGGAGVQWTPTNDTLLYARYERAYQALSFNTGVVSANPLAKAESIDAVMAGYKKTFGRKLAIDLEGYYYNWENEQTPVTVSIAGTTQTQFINVPKAVSAGLDIIGNWTPIDHLNLALTYSYNYSAIRTKCTGTVVGGVLTPAAGALCLVDTLDPNAVEPGARPFPGQAAGTTRDQGVDGSPLIDAPRHKLALDVGYTWAFDPGDLNFSGALIYRSEQDSSVFDRWYNNAPGWTAVNLRATWRSREDKYEVIASVNNLFDSNEYVAAGNGTGLTGNATQTTTTAKGLFLSNNYILAGPRTFTFEFRYKFF